ncbi:collagen alpha-1(I) chain-like [Talpa occidentalis]|uniref:collagen alpha-1(I) chain-like n=1 Tax=Talpa occidentalis TaxID=50954 RepID=UPI00188EB8F6|nr:collagen alpha-1(I) chain-like [Talpa occidentalis]
MGRRRPSEERAGREGPGPSGSSRRPQAFGRSSRGPLAAGLLRTQPRADPWRRAGPAASGHPCPSPWRRRAGEAAPARAEEARSSRPQRAAPGACGLPPRATAIQNRRAGARGRQLRPRIAELLESRERPARPWPPDGTDEQEPRLGSAPRGALPPPSRAAPIDLSGEGERRPGPRPGKAPRQAQRAAVLPRPPRPGPATPPRAGQPQAAQSRPVQPSVDARPDPQPPPLGARKRLSTRCSSQGDGRAAGRPGSSSPAGTVAAAVSTGVEPPGGHAEGEHEAGPSGEPLRGSEPAATLGPGLRTPRRSPGPAPARPPEDGPERAQRTTGPTRRPRRHRRADPGRKRRERARRDVRGGTSGGDYITRRAARGVTSRLPARGGASGPADADAICPAWSGAGGRAAQGWASGRAAGDARALVRERRPVPGGGRPGAPAREDAAARSARPGAPPRRHDGGPAGRPLAGEWTRAGRRCRGLCRPWAGPGPTGLSVRGGAPGAAVVLAPARCPAGPGGGTRAGRPGWPLDVARGGGERPPGRADTGRGRGRPQAQVRSGPSKGTGAREAWGRARAEGPGCRGRRCWRGSSPVSTGVFSGATRMHLPAERSSRLDRGHSPRSVLEQAVSGRARAREAEQSVAPAATTPPPARGRDEALPGEGEGLGP